MQLQIVLFIRLLCSLPTMVCDTVSNIVHQVTMLPSFTGNLHCCKSGHFAHCLFQFIPIFPNLFEFFLNLFAFLSKKRGHVKKFDDQFLAKTDKYLPNFYIINLKAPSFHIQYSIHIRLTIIINSRDESNSPKITT